jgi:predicted amidohydrolase YtcJ
MLISNAECLLFSTGFEKNGIEKSTAHQLSSIQQDIRIDDGVVAEIGNLKHRENEPHVDAAGGALLPGLKDHHVHLASFAASLNSVSCGPPEIESSAALIAMLNDTPGSGWLRGVNYFESVAGDIDRSWLDKYGPRRPVKIQHRTGRLWILNSAAMDLLANPKIPHNGRLFDADTLVRATTSLSSIDIKAASEALASFGVTGINDMTPANDLETFKWFARLQQSGELLQKVRLSGTAELSSAANIASKLTVGEFKIHLHDSDLPEFSGLCTAIQASHSTNRNVAIHCVTETELVFALSALQEAGIQPGDRIEHGSVMPESSLALIQETGLWVVTQPNFVTERGDAYLCDIPQSQHSALYRCASLMRHDIPLGFGTDLPFGNSDPWLAMKAATLRATSSGKVLGLDERITPETSLACFLGALDKPGQPCSIRIGDPADFCLLHYPWARAREDLSRNLVRSTMVNGEFIYQHEAEN